MRISLVLCLLFIASISFAQNHLPPIGIGVSLNANLASNYAFHVPINFDHFRLEPEIGVRFTSSESSSNASYTSSSSVSLNDNSARNINIAAGFYYMFGIDHDLYCYVGPRLGVIFVSSDLMNTSINTDSTLQSTVVDDRKSHSINYSAGVAIGAEYFFAPHFSAGAEVLLYYYHQGAPTITETRTETPPNPTPTITTNSNSGSSFNQASSVYLRWYF